MPLKIWPQKATGFYKDTAIIARLKNADYSTIEALTAFAKVLKEKEFVNQPLKHW